MTVTVLLALGLILSVTASAPFEVSIFPLERKVKPNETAMFEIELSHNSPSDELFEVYSNDVTWDVRPETTLRVPVGKRFKSNLLIRPLNVQPGAYNLPVNFKVAGSTNSQKQVLYIEVTSQFDDDSNYLPAVRGIATIDPEVDPRKPVTLKLSLENQNRRTLDKVEVKVRSKVVNKDYTTSLGPLEKKTLTFIADIDAKTPAQKDILQISVIVPEQEKAYQFDLFPINYEVVQYGTVIPSVDADSSFLKRVENITLVNDANKVVTYVHRVPAWFGKRWFVSSIPQAKIDSGDLTWEFTLEPGEQMNVVVTYNYRTLFWVLLITCVGVGAYLVFRSPIKVMKRATVLRTHEEGILEVKVIIELVNRSSKLCKHVRVMDLVPHMAQVVQEFKETILAPSKIVPHDQRGTLVRWDIDLMDPKEHRILMYRLRTNLSVLGGLTLPVTAVHFVVDGHQRESVSNKPEVRVRL